uniref:Putative secreted protein n=1 Tax=Anopheles darlingi TaxID=43151 RepID=A0A2M4DN26_ANODA
MRLMGAARTRAGFLARVALLFTEILSAGRLHLQYWDVFSKSAAGTGRTTETIRAGCVRFVWEPQQAINSKSGRRSSSGCR